MDGIGVVGRRPEEIAQMIEEGLDAVSRRERGFTCSYVLGRRWCCRLAVDMGGFGPLFLSPRVRTRSLELGVVETPRGATFEVYLDDVAARSFAISFRLPLGHRCQYEAKRQQGAGSLYIGGRETSQQQGSH